MKLSKSLSMLSWATTKTAPPVSSPYRQPNAKWIDLPAVDGGASIQEQGTAATDTRVYLLGGIPSNSNNSWTVVPSIDTFKAYSFQENSWKGLTPIPKAFTHVNTDAVNGKIYVLGKLSGGGVDLV
ncbi:hypothetical protein F4781DRAFT_371612 [Annulohypoxylon bovei var. microspora]|nr:hypothetical protein F4781DRAFT_371612 [Annulohypoxylon bovei var. microspora]